MSSSPTYSTVLGETACGMRWEVHYRDGRACLYYYDGTGGQAVVPLPREIEQTVVTAVHYLRSRSKADLGIDAKGE